MVKDGEVFFVGKDVATILGYANPRKAIRDHVEEDDKRGNESFPHSKMAQNAVIINESGLYSLVLASKMPKAKKFYERSFAVYPQARTVCDRGTFEQPRCDDCCLDGT